MALAPLTDSLGDRTVPDGATAGLIAEMLAAASSEIREAAGAPISQATSTIKVIGPSSHWLRLPGGPVSAVSAVEVDGVAVTDWRLLEGALWRAAGWCGREPVEVTVTMVHGFVEVPEDIVSLCRDLATAGIVAAIEGEGAKVGMQSEQEAIDDWSRSRTYITGGESSAGVMELPERTRSRLRSRFGGGVYVTSGL